jgi:hypothetical protein
VLWKINTQLPAPPLSGPVQLSPELAITFTVPVGVPFPVTLKFAVTPSSIIEGLGTLETMAGTLAALVAVVDWIAVAEL